VIIRLHNETSQQHAIQMIVDAPLDKNLLVEIRQDTETRSDKQNRLMHEWYAELGKATGNGTQYETHLCKLRYGVPIVRRENPDYCQQYDKFIKPHAYEDKLEMMEFWPVTRRPFMDTKMMTEYLEAIDRHAAEQGIVLTHPDDLYMEAMGI